jgi:hypothetical protein
MGKVPKGITKQNCQVEFPGLILIPKAHYSADIYFSGLCENLSLRNRQETLFPSRFFNLYGKFLFIIGSNFVQKARQQKQPDRKSDRAFSGSEHSERQAVLYPVRKKLAFL